MYTLSYMNRRGAGVSKRLTGVEAAKLIPTIKAEARLIDDAGQLVGGVEDYSDRFDDRRCRWNWWFESDIQA